MATASQPSYQLLVANFSRPTQSSESGSDTAEMAPTKTRTGFVFRHVQNLGFASDHTQGTAVGASSVVTSTLNAQFDPFSGTPPPRGDVEVVDNTFAGLSASLFVGPYELVSGRDYLVGGGAAATATAIATAVSNLPGYTGTPAGAVVTVEGPLGQVGLRFEAAYRGGAANFAFTYVDQDGVLSQGIGAGPIEPPTILPPGVPNGVAP
jgi:hypothetical protein